MQAMCHISKTMRQSTDCDTRTRWALCSRYSKCHTLSMLRQCSGRSCIGDLSAAEAASACLNPLHRSRSSIIRARLPAAVLADPTIPVTILLCTLSTDTPRNSLYTCNNVVVFDRRALHASENSLRVSANAESKNVNKCVFLLTCQ